MEKEIDFRCLTLEDEIWIQESFPNYSEKMTTNSLDMGILSAVCYRCIINKELFSSEKVEEIGESGEKEVKLLGGLTLFRRNICDQSDQLALMTSFVEICNKSRPKADKAVKKKTKSKKLILWPLLMVFVLATIGVIAKLWG